MGDIAYAIIEGLLCEMCGVVIDGKESGYPRACPECNSDGPSPQVEDRS